MGAPRPDLDRRRTRRPSGARTGVQRSARRISDSHLVSLGAAVFTMAGAYGVTPFLGEGPIRVSFDPTRVAAQVVTGIGFLGAGAIMRQGVTVRGLTTAAALWVTAAIGTAAGLGYWGAAIAASRRRVVALRPQTTRKAPGRTVEARPAHPGHRDGLEATAVRLGSRNRKSWGSHAFDEVDER